MPKVLFTTFTASRRIVPTWCRWQTNCGVRHSRLSVSRSLFSIPQSHEPGQKTKFANKKKKHDPYLRLNLGEKECRVGLQSHRFFRTFPLFQTLEFLSDCVVPEERFHATARHHRGQSDRLHNICGYLACKDGRVSGKKKNRKSPLIIVM